MMRLKLTLIFTIVSILTYSQKINPYYNCGSLAGNINDVKENVVSLLSEKGFYVTGSYNVSSKSNLLLLVVTSKELQSVCLKVKDKGVIASTLRIGFEQKGSNVDITILNPKYMFMGYLRKNYTTYKTTLDNIDSNFKTILKSLTNTQNPFGGEVSESELKHYHYMAMMPYFEDNIELKQFDSFDKAISTIDANLAKSVGNCKKVYKLSFNDEKMAVYGIGLLDKAKGEPHFLPIIGEKNFVAMPYEIVVIDNKAYMLHGRFRFALYWPSLTMGTFTKIMSTPGDVNETLGLLVK